MNSKVSKMNAISLSIFFQFENSYFLFSEFLVIFFMHVLR